MNKSLTNTNRSINESVNYFSKCHLPFDYHFPNTLSYRSSDIDADRVNDFLFEIEHLEDRLNTLNNLLDRNELRVRKNLMNISNDLILVLVSISQST